MQSLSRLARLLEQGPVAALFAIGTGAACLLAALSFKLDKDSPGYAPAAQLTASVAGLLLAAYGAVLVANMVLRSAAFVRRSGSRVRLQSPVRVLPEGGAPAEVPARRQPPAEPPSVPDHRQSSSEPRSDGGYSAMLDAQKRDMARSIQELRDALAGSDERSRRALDAERSRAEAAIEEKGRLRRALDVAITWLYRRQNWAGLSPDARYSDPAPAGIWVAQKYRDLDVEGVITYVPPAQVGMEPGWEPPSDARAITAAPAGDLVAPRGEVVGLGSGSTAELPLDDAIVEALAKTRARRLRASNQALLRVIQAPTTDQDRAELLVKFNSLSDGVCDDLLKLLSAKARSLEDNKAHRLQSGDLMDVPGLVKAGAIAAVPIEGVPGGAYIELSAIGERLARLVRDEITRQG